MVCYFPRNGKSAIVNGFPITRSGYPCQFEIEAYEKFVKMGILVKTPQEMAPLSEADLKKQIEQAKEEKRPVYVPPSDEGIKLKGIDEESLPKLDNNINTLNEYDNMFLAALKAKEAEHLAKGEVAKKPAEEVVLPNVKQTIQESNVQLEELKPEGVFSNLVKKDQEMVSSNNPIFAGKAIEPLTYEKALSYVKTNPDGSLKVGKDGLYVMTLGAKPYSKNEICEVINSHK